ncbi:MAG: serine hydrolase [Chloroflexota bacterium]|nr:serine hydrolase [Chloroflexota bacterium]
MTGIFTRGTITRRSALRAGAASVAATFGTVAVVPRVLAQETTPAAEVNRDGLSEEIVEAFTVLPGQKGLRLWAPPDAGRPEWSAALNPDDRLFIASVFKGFVLAECLRREEDALDPRGTTPLAGQLAARLGQQLTLDESVFTLGSPVFNPPNLTGQVTLRTALEAMITHSDNTATDMVLQHVGPERVRAFIDGIGPRQSEIPTSTRQFFGYVAGVPDWRATTWAELQGEDAPGATRPILNDTITMASTASEMVAFYARALPGECFQYAETLSEFRNILAMGDVLITMPLGVNGFGKGGSIDFDGSHVLNLAGGLYVPDRWVYFALLLNWTDAEGGTSAEVRGPAIAAARTIFTLVRDRLRP